jgi:hypothetical protein
MRHRSVIAFILLAAILVAVPQAMQDILALKSALGERVRNEILFAFLNLNPRDGASQPAPQRARLSQPTCPASTKTVTQTASNSKKQGGAANAHAKAQGAESNVVVEVSGEEFGQLAMMLTPSAEIYGERSRLEVREGLDALVQGKGSKIPAPELSMIIPPGEGLDPIPPRRQKAEQEKAAKARVSPTAEWESRTSFVAAQYVVRSDELRKAGENIRLQFADGLKDGRAFRIPAAAPRVRVTKSKRQGVTNATPPAPSAPRQLKQLACDACEPGSTHAPEASASE